MKFYHDRHAKFRELSVGDTVLARDHLSKQKWQSSLRLDLLEKNVDSIDKAIDDMQKWQSSLRLDLLEKNVDSIDKAIDDMLHYSYQYNLKIVGVPQINENESSEDTANLCLKLFSVLGNDISAYDIDIAHRVPQRNATIDNGR